MFQHKSWSGTRTETFLWSHLLLALWHSSFHAPASKSSIIQLSTSWTSHLDPQLFRVSTTWDGEIQCYKWSVDFVVKLQYFTLWIGKGRVERSYWVSPLVSGLLRHLVLSLPLCFHKRYVSGMTGAIIKCLNCVCLHSLNTAFLLLRSSAKVAF